MPNTSASKINGNDYQVAGGEGFLEPFDACLGGHCEDIGMSSYGLDEGF